MLMLWFKFSFDLKIFKPVLFFVPLSQFVVMILRQKEKKKTGLKIFANERKI